jgi:hypothetical protein
MKIIINENQIDKLYPFLEKNWSKNEYPKFDYSLIKLLRVPGNQVNKLSQMFYDYLGTDEVEERIERLMSEYGTWTEINNCGSYNFHFVLDSYEIDYDDAIIYIHTRYDKYGTVINPEGERLTLYDAVRDFDYGFEYVFEIQDCIVNVINEEFLTETGLYAQIVI